jgi:hypothetical protein
MNEESCSEEMCSALREPEPTAARSALTLLLHLMGGSGRRQKLAGNNSELFEATRSHGITTKTLERLASWSNRRLFSLLEELRQTTTEPKNISQGPFSGVKAWNHRVETVAARIP